MNKRLLKQAKTIGDALMSEHPVLKAHVDHLTVLLVGSLGAGFADELSDVDFWIMCSNGISGTLSSEFERLGLRFNELPPNDTSLGDTVAHYFVFPIGKFEHALEIYDDYALSLISHSVVFHDAGGQFAILAGRFGNLPKEVVRQKVATAYARVRQYATGAKERLRRFHPLVWLQDVCDMLMWFLRLGCWLDGQAPTGPKWLLRQAQSCSTAPIVMPAAMQLLQTIGPAIERGASQVAGESPLLGAMAAVDSAARLALDSTGFADIPKYEPPAGAHTDEHTRATTTDKKTGSS